MFCSKVVIRSLGLVVALSVLLGCTISAANEKLYVYYWVGYIPESVFIEFTEETGIEVLHSTYESNEEMYDTLSETNGNGYDVIVPSSYFVSMMVERGLLRKIELERLEHYANLDKRRLGKYSDYGVPYFWGATILAVNSSLFSPESITSWSDLLKPEYAGKIVLTDDLRDVFSMALYTLGFSINTRNSDEIHAAYDWLSRLRAGVEFLPSEEVLDRVNKDKVPIALMYNGDIAFMHGDNPEYVAVYPKEGVPLWIDYLAIPTGAKNVNNAYRFIDFLLRADICKRVTEDILYSTPNVEAYKLLDEEIRQSPVLYPADSKLGDSEFLDSVGSALPLYERYWQMLQSE